METTLPWPRQPARIRWHDLVLPKEHGSWSLALEPLALGLIAAPSAAGWWLATAVVAAFFARRPLRIAVRDDRPERRAAARAALAVCTLIALTAMSAAVALGGWNWVIWLVPPVIAGAVFLSFDVRNAGREESAEVAGATAFALLPAALAILGGQPPALALALAVVMCGRAVPTVLCVRAVLRAAKTGVRRDAPALTTAGLALLSATALAYAGLAPSIAAFAMGVLALRACAWLLFPRPAWRARTLGIVETVLGLAFVIAIGAAIAWPAPNTARFAWSVAAFGEYAFL